MTIEHNFRGVHYYTLYDSISQEITKKDQEIMQLKSRLEAAENPSATQHQLNKVYAELHVMVHERDSLQQLVQHWPGDTTLTRQLVEVKRENVNLRMVQAEMESSSRYWQLLMDAVKAEEMADNMNQGQLLVSRKTNQYRKAIDLYEQVYAESGVSMQAEINRVENKLTQFIEASR